MQIRWQRFLGLGTAVLAFMVYWLTLAPDLTWQGYSGDGGELITAAVTLGIPHPPGYPTYVLLGKLVSYLPFEPVAYRFHLFSALCAAGGAGLVTATTQESLLKTKNNQPPFLAVVPGLLFAFSPLVWQQAVVAEVYSLNLLMTAAFLWALLGKRPSFITGLFLGISLTTHLTSLFLLPLALTLTQPRAWSKMAAGVIIGASPYLLLPVLARSGSPVVWGNPTTLEGWWWLVSGKIYQPNQFALPRAEFGHRLVNWLGEFVQQLAVVGWLLLVWHNNSLKQKKWLGLLATSAFYLIYSFFYSSPDAIVLTLPALLMFSLCLIPTHSTPGRWSFLLPGLAVLLHLVGQTGANIHNIRLQAERILGLAPPDAILITSGDPDIFALWYFHHIEGMRPDIFLVDDQLFAFDWYRQTLKQQHPTLRALEKDNLILFSSENNVQYAICQAGFSSATAAEPMLDCVQESD